MRDIASIQSGQRGSKFITPRGGRDAVPPSLPKDTRRQRRRTKSSVINDKVQLRVPPSRCSAPSLVLLVACFAVAASALAVGAFAAASAITITGRTAMTGGVNGPEGGAFGHALAGAPVMLTLDSSNSAASSLWKFDAATNALLSSVTLTILGVTGASCFAHGTTGYFGSFFMTTTNWQLVALDTMIAGATSSIDSTWRGCSLEPTSGAFALCTRNVNPMVIAKLTARRR
jgi:hypothetical protein